MAQIKIMVKKENPGVSSKRIRKKFNKIKKDKIKKDNSNYVLKNIFRRLTGAMFSQISKDGRFAQVNLNEDEKKHGQESIEALLTDIT